MSVAREVLTAVVAELRADPVLLGELRAVLGTERVAPTKAPLLLFARRERYSRRVGLSVRTLDNLLPPACWVGAGKLRRVRVAEADAWLSEHLGDEREAAESGDDVTALARRQARAGGA